MALGLETHHSDALTVVVVSGELDLDTGNELRNLLVDLVRGGARDLLLDLDGLDYIDSTGLGVLARGLKEARRRGGSFELVCGHEHRLREVFRITGLDRVFAIHADAGLQRAGA